jgi:hypothetical protein
MEVAQDRVQWQVLLLTVLKLWVLLPQSHLVSHVRIFTDAKR